MDTPNNIPRSYSSTIDEHDTKKSDEIEVSQLKRDTGAFKTTNNIDNTDNVVVDIKEEKKEEKSNNEKKIDRKKEKPTTMIRNMLRTRSRATPTPTTGGFGVNRGATPNPFMDDKQPDKISPSLDTKPYEMGSVGSSPYLWTDETEQHLLDFGDICNESAKKCKNSSIKHSRIGNSLQILVVLLGALSATTSIGNIATETKAIINTISGSLVALLTSVQSFLKFPQQAEVEANGCLELERMSRNVKIELSKAKEFRVDPYKYIIKLENQREKILRKVGIEDD